MAKGIQEYAHVQGEYWLLEDTFDVVAQTLNLQVRKMPCKFRTLHMSTKRELFEQREDSLTLHDFFPRYGR